MNQDTNREDRVERTVTATGIVWNCHRAYFKVCVQCGSTEDSKGIVRCPCGQPEESA